MEAELEGPSQALPTGTITFLFTDIEGSVAKWERDPEAMRAAVARHHAILHAAAEGHGGHVFKIVGDEFQVSFPLPAQALQAALAAQRALRDEAWGTTGPLKVRMGLHTGPAGLVEGVLNTRDYAVSRTLNRVGRIRSAGHGGQVLLSLATAELLRGRLPPDVALKDLGLHYFKGLAQPEHIFQVNAPDLPTAFPTLISTPRPHHNLPVQLTAFVGREREIAQIRELLEEQRLVTVLGAGGTGKTRLALEVAATQLDRYADGVFFVALAPLRREEEMVPAVARALGFSFYAEGTARGPDREQRVPKEQLLDYVRRKQLLLVMDNLEHLLPLPSSPPVGGKEGGNEDGTQLLAEILQTAPQVDILVTSRVRLNLQGEHLFHLAGMRYPEQAKEMSASASAQVLVQLAEEGAAYSAVQLFVAAAGRVQAGFELTTENAEDVVRICRLVDGMPLGLLLAAAWVELLTPREIADEIAQSLDFLETELRDVPERQRSLRATFDHSWRLLTDRDRELLAGLSVFQGGFGQAGAEAVTGATLRELMSLANKSLVERDVGGRYRLHELIRQYALEKLALSPDSHREACERHCAYNAAALEGWAADLKGPKQAAALAEMDLEIENARAAWDWAVAQRHVKRLEQALEGLCHFYRWRLRREEGETACRAAAGTLTKPTTDDESRVLGAITARWAVFRQVLGDRERADQLLTHSLSLLDALGCSGRTAQSEQAYILFQMGNNVFDSDWERSRRLYEQSLDTYRDLGDQYWTAVLLERLGAHIAIYLGEYDAGEKLLRESIAIRQVLGDEEGMASTLITLGTLRAGVMGHFEEGEAAIREGIAIRRRQRNKAGEAHGLGQLFAALMPMGRYEEACLALEEGAAIYAELGLHRALNWFYIWLGFSQMYLGRYEPARALGAGSLVSSREMDQPDNVARALRLIGCVTLVDGAYVQAQVLLTESVNTYRSFNALPHELATVLYDLSLAERGLGRATASLRHLCEGLRTGADLRAATALVLGLPPASLFLLDRGAPERAVEVYALTARYGAIANSRWFEDVVGREIEAASADLPPEVVAAAQARGRARDLEETVVELLAEFEAAEGQ